MANPIPQSDYRRTGQMPAWQDRIPHEATDPRPGVLVFVGGYLPGYKYGGPIQSVSSIVEALGNRVRFLVVTSDRDLGDKQRYCQVPHDASWMRVGSAEVAYLDVTCSLHNWIRKVRTIMQNAQIDTIYLNSFFSFRFSIIPVWLVRVSLKQPVRVVIAPRGEFSIGALGIKRLKKRVWLMLGRLTHFYDGVIWHATGDMEAADIRREMGRNSDVQVAHPIALGSARLGGVERGSLAEEHGPLRVVFFSRISPKKNLLYALDVMGRAGISAAFDIIGPIEDNAYWQQCQSRIAALPSRIVVKYLGGLSHEEALRRLYAYHVMLFPTMGENYGHVIEEALNAGLAVVTTDQTPWTGLEAARIGWSLSLSDIESFVTAMQQLAAGCYGSWNGLRERAKNYLALRDDGDILADNFEILTGVGDH